MKIFWRQKKKRAVPFISENKYIGPSKRPKMKSQHNDKLQKKRGSFSMSNAVIFNSFVLFCYASIIWEGSYVPWVKTTTEK